MPIIVKNPSAVAIPVTAVNGKDKYSITILPRTSITLREGFTLSSVTKKTFPKLQVSVKDAPKEVKPSEPKEEVKEVAAKQEASVQDSKGLNVPGQVTKREEDSSANEKRGKN